MKNGSRMSWHGAWVRGLLAWKTAFGRTVYARATIVPVKGIRWNPHKKFRELRMVHACFDRHDVVVVGNFGVCGGGGASIRDTAGMPRRKPARRFWPWRYRWISPSVWQTSPKQSGIFVACHTLSEKTPDSTVALFGNGPSPR